MGTTDALPNAHASFQPRPSGRGQQPRVGRIGLQRIALTFQNIVQRAGKMLRGPNSAYTSAMSPKDPVGRALSSASERASGVGFPGIENSTRLDIRIDDAVYVICPHMQAVEYPGAELADFYDGVSHQFACFLRLEQTRLLSHLASTIGFQRGIGRDAAALTVAAQMVETPTSVAGQPGTVADECDQIQHRERGVQGTIVLMSMLYPALTGAVG